MIYYDKTCRQAHYSSTLVGGGHCFSVVPSISRGNGVSPPTLLTLLFCRGDGVGDTILRPLLIGGNIEWHPHSMFPAIHEGGVEWGRGHSTPPTISRSRGSSSVKFYQASIGSATYVASLLLLCIARRPVAYVLGLNYSWILEFLCGLISHSLMQQKHSQAISYFR